MSDDESFYSDQELQLAIADSYSWLKQKREATIDDELAFKLQLDEAKEYRHISVSIEQSNQQVEIQWSCSKCTFLNSSNAYVCDLCETPRSGLGNKSTILTRNNHSAGIDPEYYIQQEEMEEFWNATEESLRAASTAWTCLTCMSVNSINIVECTQCREPKSATIMAQEELNKSWPCPTCTFDNSYNDVDCFMCGHSIPTQFRSHLNHKRPSECGLPGCCTTVSHYGFCSQDHFERALRRNIIPPCEFGVEAVLVGHTGDYSAHLLRSSHEKHTSVKKQFLDAWKKGDVIPRVERIFWIRMKPEILEKFEQTKRKIGSNIQRLFHGTSQSSHCLFGTNQSKPPCLDKACRVCSIIRTSFDLIHVKRGEGGRAWAHQTQQLRYGVSTKNWKQFLFVSLLVLIYMFTFYTGRNVFQSCQ